MVEAHFHEWLCLGLGVWLMVWTVGWRMHSLFYLEREEKGTATELICAGEGRPQISS